MTNHTSLKTFRLQLCNTEGFPTHTISITDAVKRNRVQTIGIPCSQEQAQVMMQILVQAGFERLPDQRIGVLSV